MVLDNLRNTELSDVQTYESHSINNQTCKTLVTIDNFQSVNTSNIQFGTAQPSTPQNPSGNIQFIPQPPQTPQNEGSAIKIDDQNITSFGKKYNTNNTSSVAEEE